MGKITAGLPKGGYKTEGAVTVEISMEYLSVAMKKDTEYAWSWHCNIAMAAHDKGLDHKPANEAAANFMKTCFGVDTSRNKNYEY